MVESNIEEKRKVNLKYKGSLEYEIEEKYKGVHGLRSRMISSARPKARSRETLSAGSSTRVWET